MTSKPKEPTTDRPRLRMKPLSDPLRIVLVNPEIPQNTGNIARICAATGAHLHLVGSLGFSIDEKAVRRAGLDYWHLVAVHRHETFTDFLQSNPGAAPPLLFTAGASDSYLSAPYRGGSALVFGAESCGLPLDIIERWVDFRYGIPTLENSVRSLNLANAVSIVVYKALETLDALRDAELTP